MALRAAATGCVETKGSLCIPADQFGYFWATLFLAIAVTTVWSIMLKRRLAALATVAGISRPELTHQIKQLRRISQRELNLRSWAYLFACVALGAVAGIILRSLIAGVLVTWTLLAAGVMLLQVYAEVLVRRWTRDQRP